MRRPRDISLRHKLTLIMLATSAVALLLASAAFVASDTADHRRTVTENLRTRAEILANATAAPLAFKLPEDAAATLKALRGDPEVLAAALYDENGKLFTSYARENEGGRNQPPPHPGQGAEVRDGCLRLFHPVMVEGNRLGTIFLLADLTPLRARFVRYLQIAALVFLGALAAAYLVSTALQRLVSRPILQLAVVARGVAEHKDYSVRAPKSGADELGQLYDDFNEMLVQIESREVALRQAQDQLEERVRQRTAELEAANRQLTEEVGRRQKAEKDIRLLAEALRCCSDCVSITDLDDKTLFVNEAFCRTYGFAAHELIGCSITVARPGKDLSGHPVGFREAGREGDWHGELLDRRQDGSEFPVWLSTSYIRDAQGRPTALIGVAQDLTERKQLEEQLRQAQKMEAVGQLAAGVAHDFNNIMTVIQGRASLLLMDLGEEGDLAESAREIETAAQRAANVTRQLLAYSRKQVLNPKLLDLNEVVTSVSRLLVRLLGEHIVMRCELAGHLLAVRADSSMLEQVIINLAVNSRDAMPEGGSLTLRTSAVVFDVTTGHAHPDRREGRFVCLEVTDTGCGMSPETLKHVFEPFFTTKDVGKGTGLGLATVYGILKQHEGWIEARSREGQGSSFAVYLPDSGEMGPHLEQAADPQAAGPGRETILVVEDEDSVRELAGVVLRRHGYRVWLAGSGKEALRIWDQVGSGVDLVLTDMVMPGGLSGGELVERLRARQPRLKVIYSSGYSLELIARGMGSRENARFLAKPYPAEVLLDVVRKALDA